MPPIICIRTDWDHTAVPLPALEGRWHTVHVGPEPGYPAGRRGRDIAAAWAQYSKGTQAAGLLMADGDMAFDPIDIREMREAIGTKPGWVWTAPYRIWPASTTRPGWTWAHHSGGPHNHSQALEYDDVHWFGLGFTYLPAPLIAHCLRAGLRKWTFPHVDTEICKRAAAMDLDVGVVATCEPKHLHY